MKKEDTEITKLQDDLAAATEKMEEYMNGWKRAKADYINFKKETESKQQEMIHFANAAVILQMVPIYDNFKLAWNHIPEEQQKADWVSGIGQIKKQFKDLLGTLGIEEIKTVGEQFNPEMHEAVGKEKVAGKKTDEIIEEVKSGYKLHGKILDPAKVKVAE